jgi:Cu(I)/Ag(I) efflux system membrane fusion protein
MKRLVIGVAFVAAASAVGSVSYKVGTGELRLPSLPAEAQAYLPSSMRAASTSEDGPASGPIIYYRHPDGEPAYSATPRQTDDGRAFVAVLASEDLSFDKPAEAVIPASNAEAGERVILYYRNPMGLPDTSPVPKLDSMGMDYIPVYAGEDDDGSTVTVSAGKQQRTGVKTAPATRSAIARPVNVPGTVVLDERRVSVVSIRTEAFIEEVSDVTSGSTIAKGQPLVRFYAKEIAAAGALYAADVKSGGGAAARGSLQRLENLGVPKEAIAEIEKTGKVPISVTLMAPRAAWCWSAWRSTA